MLSIVYVKNHRQLEYQIHCDELVDFLYDNLSEFRDSKSAIRKSIEYAMSDEPGMGGSIFLARENNELVGVLVMNNTGMSEFIPESILVYVAVKDDHRGKGIGSEIIKTAMNELQCPIALHVEYNNPAIHLYERLGFTSKYAEMRFTPKVDYNDNP